MLFKSYLQILLMVIFAPILLLFEAMPGKSAFSWWFKNIFAEILTFPMVIALLLISYVLTNTITASGTLWSPPFLFGINPEAYSMLVGAGIIYLAPELVKIAKELMGVKPLPVSIGPGTFLGSAGVALAGVQKGAGTFSSLTQMPGIGNWLLAKAQEQRKSGGGLLSNLIPPSVGEQVARAMREEKK